MLPIPAQAHSDENLLGAGIVAVRIAAEDELVFSRRQLDVGKGFVRGGSLLFRKPVAVQAYRLVCGVMQFDIVVIPAVGRLNARAVDRRHLGNNGLLMFRIPGAVDGIEALGIVGLAGGGLGIEHPFPRVLRRPAAGQVGGQVVDGAVVHLFAVGRVQRQAGLLTREDEIRMEGAAGRIGFGFARQVDHLIAARRDGDGGEHPFIGFRRVVRQGEGGQGQLLVPVVMQLHPGGELPVLVGEGDAALGGVLVQAHLRVGGGHPVAAHGGGVGFRIRGAGCGLLEIDGFPFRVGAAGGIIRQIPHLHAADLPAMGIVENNIFFLGIDAEGHMNDPVLRVHPLRAGSENHQIVPGPYLHLGEDKFALFPHVVGQGIALQVNGFIRGVVQLDPIGVISLVVRERAVILGHDLGEDQAACGSAARRAGGEKQR